jgi:hypothetical protein
MIVYIDESGDLGWKFDAPYRFGGSSRYLTIAFLLIPNAISHLPKRIVRELYRKFKIPANIELKGAGLSHIQLDFFVDKAIDLIMHHPEIRILTITVQKENVAEHIRNDPNKIYNYMIRLALLDQIITESEVTLIPDPRSIKVKSGDSLLDYLQLELWFELGAKTQLSWQTVQSENSLNLKFIDIIAHLIWSNYENNDSHYADLLLLYMKCRKLFFNNAHK